MQNLRSFRQLLGCLLAWGVFFSIELGAGPAKELRSRPETMGPEDLQYIAALTSFAVDVENGSLDRPSGRLQLFINPNLERLLRTLDIANESNSKGAFQVFYYEAVPHLTYVSQGKSYYLEKDRDTVRILLGPSPLERLVMTQGLEPDILKNRFLVPDDWILVGLETNLYGSIVPLFSTSRVLIESRVPSPEDQNDFQQWLALNVIREVRELPLHLTPHIGKHSQPDENLRALPNELLDLIVQGQTLTTEPSLRDRLRYDPRATKEFVPTPYSIHMVMNRWMSGRSGFLSKNGIPLLGKIEDQEFFVEIKGAGVGVFDPRLTSIQNRWSGLHRSGRISQSAMLGEFHGYVLLLKLRKQTELERRLLYRPAIGVILPEHYTEDRPWSPDAGADHTSAQLFRLATSTRRAAYGKNLAYGSLYSDKQLTMNLTQTAFGNLLGDLWVRNPHYQFHSPHAQNFVSYPIHRIINPTDYSEVTLGTDRPFIPLEDELYVFRSLNGRRRLLFGLANSLQPRGLWRDRIQGLYDTEFTREALCAALIAEFATLSFPPPSAH